MTHLARVQPTCEDTHIDSVDKLRSLSVLLYLCTVCMCMSIHRENIGGSGICTVYD